MGTDTAAEGRFFKSLSRFLLKSMLDDHATYIKGISTGNPEDRKFVLEPAKAPINLLMFINPTYWIPEAFSRGHWRLERGDLGDFLQHVVESAPNSYGKYLRFRRSMPTILHLVKQRLFHRYFTRKVKSHYNVDPDIYSQFLDPEMVYTCAFFDTAHTLSQAQQQKFKTVVDRLELPDKQPRILNIGCGWGSFERFITRLNPCARVTGLSISEEQISWANLENISNLTKEQNDRIQLFNRDYLNHFSDDGYDAITAIGMVEHVGQAGYQEFFKKTFELLKPGRILLIHMIVKPKSNEPTNRWIDRYIFPGGYAPSISELTKAAESQSLRVKNVHIHHPNNYQRTLVEWRKRLNKNREKIANIYVEKHGLQPITAAYLVRQWEIYFAGSEASFRRREEPHQVAHFVFER